MGDVSTKMSVKMDGGGWDGKLKSERKCTLKSDEPMESGEG